MSSRTRRWAAPGALAAAIAATGAIVTVAGATEPARSTLVGGEAAVAPVIHGQVGRCSPAGARRVAGRDRYETAAIASTLVPGEGGTVYVATGRSYADALAAGPAAVRATSVVLLTEADRLPEATREALGARAPAEIVVVGGASAVSEAVARELRAYAPTRRLAGEDRYATAADVALDGHVAADVGGTVYLATGEDFADALAAGPAAGLEAAPVLLTRRDTLPASTREALETLRPREVVVVGGEAAVSAEVEREVATTTPARTTRIAGADRFATAAALGRRAAPDADAAHLATGLTFADALAAGPVAAAARQPLLLVGRDLTVPTARDLVDREAVGTCRAIDVTVDDIEALTLGPGDVLTAVWSVGSAVLERTGQHLGALIPPDEDVAFRYPAPVHAPDDQVAWTQRVPADDAPLVARQPWRGERPTADGGIVLAWQALGRFEDSYRDQVRAAPGLNVTAPFTWRLRADGSATGIPSADFNDWAHARGVDVWPTVVSTDPAHIHDTLSDPDRRARLVAQLSTQARDTRSDGVNVDLEGFHDRTREPFTAFVRELTDAVHAWGGLVSVDVTSMTDTWATPPESEFAFWSTAVDRRAIASIADYTAMMAYDEHNRHRPHGPVASPPWVEEALRYQLRFTDPDRLLLGIPFYGALWRDGEVNPTYVGIAEAERRARGAPSSWDAEHQLARHRLPDGRTVWAEWPGALRHRTGLVERYGLAGVAAWRLGFDAPEVWTVLNDR